MDCILEPLGVMYVKVAEFYSDGDSHLFPGSSGNSMSFWGFLNNAT